MNLAYQLGCANGAAMYALNPHQLMNYNENQLMAEIIPFVGRVPMATTNQLNAWIEQQLYGSGLGDLGDLGRFKIKKALKSVGNAVKKVVKAQEKFVSHQAKVLKNHAAEVVAVAAALPTGGASLATVAGMKTAALAAGKALLANKLTQAKGRIDNAAANISQQITDQAQQVIDTTANASNFDVQPSIPSLVQTLVQAVVPQPPDVPQPPADWDEAAYLTVNPDVAAAVQGGKDKGLRSGYEHYVKWGKKEGRLLRPVISPVTLTTTLPDTGTVTKINQPAAMPVVSLSPSGVMSGIKANPIPWAVGGLALLLLLKR